MLERSGIFYSWWLPRWRSSFGGSLVGVEGGTGEELGSKDSALVGSKVAAGGGTMTCKTTVGRTESMAWRTRSAWVSAAAWADVSVGDWMLAFSSSQMYWNSESPNIRIQASELKSGRSSAVVVTVANQLSKTTWYWAVMARVLKLSTRGMVMRLEKSNKYSPI